MDFEEGRRTGACAMDSRLPRFLAKPKIEERRENLIEYTEEFIQARDQRLVNLVGIQLLKAKLRRFCGTVDLSCKRWRKMMKTNFMFYLTLLIGDAT